MKKITKIVLLFLAVMAFNSCSEDVPGTQELNFVSFEATSINLGVDIGGTASHEVKVYTTQVMGSDRSFNVMVNEGASSADPQAYDIPSTVTVPANSNEGTLTVGLSDVNIGSEGKSVVVDLANEAGLYTGNEATINISQICRLNEITIRFVFDGYASETSWEITDGGGTVVASGSGYADGAATAITTACLDNGEYSFTVYDSYGDGLTYPTTGNITITNSDGSELVYIDGDFGATTTETFTL